MVGYGVNTSSNNPPPSYQGDTLLNANDKPIQPKKELTLSQKQELASKLEKESQSSQINSSMSLNNLKSNTNSSKTLADNLMDKNLTDLNFSSGQKALPSSSSTNFDLLTQSMSQTSLSSSASSQQFQNSNRSLNNNQNNSFPVFNNFNQQNNFRPSMSNQNMTNNQQVGFFGNLALPAPTPNTNSAPAFGNMSSIKPMSPIQPAIQSNNLNGSFNNKPNNFPTNIPLIPGPPKLNQLNPTTNNLNFNINNNNGAKKSALDDLADIFG